VDNSYKCEIGRKTKLGTLNKNKLDKESLPDVFKNLPITRNRYLISAKTSSFFFHVAGSHDSHDFLAKFINPKP